MKNFHIKLFCLFALFQFFINHDLFACDNTPVITLSTAEEAGVGEYTVDINLCVGDGGSLNGFTTTFLEPGIDITNFTPPSITDPISGNTAVGSINNGVLSYLYAGTGVFVGFNPTCFDYTVTVNADPSATTVEFTGVNCESNQCPGSCAFVGGNTQTEDVPAPNANLTCGELFTDGPGNYSNNQNLGYIICSNSTSSVTLDFTVFSLESGFDFLTIYDSGDFTGPSVTYTGNNSPGMVTSTNLDNCLTVNFTTDGSVTGIGWEADVICCTLDTDGDGICDDVDPDDDNDGCLDAVDAYPLIASGDSDGDGDADDCDICPFDADNDIDGDGVCGDVDICPGGDDNVDTDADGVPDFCDICEGSDDNMDSDCDGVPDGCDLCDGGDDSIINPASGLPMCIDPPAFEDIPAAWKCGSKKVFMCHGGQNPHTICVNKNAISAHIAHGDYLGPCGNASCSGAAREANPSITNKLHDLKEFEIYPNPTKHEVTILITNSEYAQSKVKIFNQLGQVVFENQTDRRELNIDLDLDKFKTGVYIVTIQQGDDTQAKRLLIIK